MKLGQKIFYTVTTILEVMLLISAYMVNYFTKSKMGMARHVIHKNYVLESLYPIEIIKYVISIFLVILMLIVVYLYTNKKLTLQSKVKKMIITTIVSVIVFVVFILIGSTQVIRSFYYISTILLVVILLQIIKTFLAIIWYKK